MQRYCALGKHYYEDGVVPVDQEDLLRLLRLREVVFCRKCLDGYDVPLPPKNDKVVEEVVKKLLEITQENIKSIK